MGYIIGAVVILLMVGLVIKFWFIILPIIAAVIAAFCIYKYQHKKKERNKQMTWQEIQSTSYNKSKSSSTLFENHHTNITSVTKNEDLDVIKSCPIDYPENIAGYRKTYKTYEKVRITPCINWENDYFELLLSEPLRFVQENSQVTVYQKNLKIGYISSEKITSVINDFLQRNALIIGFLRYIDPDMNDIRISIAYYECLHNDTCKADVIEEVKAKAKVNIRIDDDTSTTAPLICDNKELCDVEENYNICIITNSEPDYSRLKQGGKIYFEQEPSNSYDHRAVKVKQSNIYIGYLYKGEMQDKVNTFIDCGNIVTGYLTKVEHLTDTSKILATILFYN